MLDWPVYFQANVVMQFLFAGGCVGEASWLVGRRFKPPGLTLGVWARGLWFNPPCLSLCVGAGGGMRSWKGFGPKLGSALMEFVWAFDHASTKA